jgi:hypothetical protein
LEEVKTVSRPADRRQVWIHALLITETANEKLGARGISGSEAQQLMDNRYVILRNTGRARRNVRELRARRLVVGRTNGGRP